MESTRRPNAGRDHRTPQRICWISLGLALIVTTACHVPPAAAAGKKKHALPKPPSNAQTRALEKAVSRTRGLKGSAVVYIGISAVDSHSAVVDVVPAPAAGTAAGHRSGITTQTYHRGGRGKHKGRRKHMRSRGGAKWDRRPQSSAASASRCSDARPSRSATTPRARM